MNQFQAFFSSGWMVIKINIKRKKYYLLIFLKHLWYFNVFFNNNKKYCDNRNYKKLFKKCNKIFCHEIKKFIGGLIKNYNKYQKTAEIIIIIILFNQLDGQIIR